MANDFIQGVIMVVMASLLAILCLNKLGGVSGLFEHINAAGLKDQYHLIKTSTNPNYADPYQYTAPWAAAVVVFTIFANLSLGNAVKFFSVKTGRDARLAAVTLGCLSLLGMVIFFIPPITAKIFFADKVNQLALNKPAEGAYAIASIELLPKSLLGMMVVAMFAATLSSMDVALNRNAAFTVRDIMPAVLRRFKINLPDPHKQMRLGQVFTVFYGFMVILVAIGYTKLGRIGMFEVALNIGALAALPMAVPLVMGILIKKAPGWSAIFTIIAALIPSIWAIIDSRFFDHVWPYHIKVFSVLTTGIIAFLVTCPFWKFSKESQRKSIDEFFKRMHTPIDFEKEVGAANDDVQLRLLGVAVIILGLFVSLLILVPQSFSDRLIVLAVVAAILAIGGIMYAIGRFKKNKL
jgi:solute:Na+ symporter, SSS family